MYSANLNCNNVHMKLETFRVCVCVCARARTHAHVHVTQLNDARWQKKVTKTLSKFSVWINTCHFKETYRAGLVYTVKCMI
jgi:hypothetical protein